ncbi:MAG TPA: response regulator transcription factor [Flavipsychrobacter sp.]|nr:response regulator transcription factor [Flavipsychrobacter sp.]
MKQKILLIEDESKLALAIQQGLYEANFETAIASTGQEGKDMFFANDYDLAIIDINLPFISGYDLIKLLRFKDKFVPIIIITALNQTDYKLKGFDLGADDYLVKPFEFKELLARINALLRRSEMKPVGGEKMMEVADLVLNLESKEAQRNGQNISLTSKEFLLLEYLLRNKNKVVSKEEIALNVWEIDFDSQTNVIEVYINYLRKKIDRDFTPKLIHTKSGMGYILKAD